MEKQRQSKIIGYCDYCKDPVLDTDNFRGRNGSIIHEDCYKQKHTYYDNLGYIEESTQ
jgi:hypothetical protein